MSGFLCKDPRNREDDLPAMVLSIRRRDDLIVLPDPDTRLEEGDEILMCGQHRAQFFINWITDNYNVLRYMHTGVEAPGGLVWGWLNSRKRMRRSR